MKKVMSIVAVVGMGIGLLLIFGVYKRKKPDTIIVGLNAEYPPFAYMDKTNQLVGFDIDLIMQINKRLEKDIELKNMSFAALIPGVQLGTVDIIISGITPTPQRAKEIIFTEPYLVSDPLVIASLKTNPIKTLDELKHKRVVVNEGYSADFYLSKLKDMDIVRLETMDQALLELLNGKADAFVSARNPLQPFLSATKDDTITTSVIPDTQETYAIGISRYKKDLADTIQSILTQLKNEGIIDALKDKWKLND